MFFNLEGYTRYNQYETQTAAYKSAVTAEVLGRSTCEKISSLLLASSEALLPARPAGVLSFTKLDTLNNIREV